MKKIRKVMANVGVILCLACAPTSAQALDDLVDFSAANEVVSKHHKSSSSSSSCETGPRGETGKTGKTGKRGKTGKTGKRGKTGHRGPKGHHGNSGSGGGVGSQGLTGPTGPAGPALNFADFFALMPGDNSATVAPDSAVLFPQDGPTNGVITRVGSSFSEFNLPNIGTYKIEFQVSVEEAGQLELRLNGVPLADTVVGRATGADQIVGVCYVTTEAVNSILEVINAPGNTTALTITLIAGGTHSVSAHLVITQVQ